LKSGKTLTELAAELDAQQQRKQDFIVDTREVRVITGESGMEVIVPSVAELRPQALFHRQLGREIGVRADLYDRLRDTHPVQFDHLVNGLLSRLPVENRGRAVRRMVRTYSDDGNGGQGIARAMLSDRYRRIDNHDLAESVLPIIGRIPDVQIPVCELTDTRMYIKVIAPAVSFDLNELTGQPTRPSVGDVVQAGFVVSNSEVGRGGLDIEYLLYRLVCDNGLIIGSAFRKTHIGSRLTAEEDYTIYRDETIAADDHALMLKVGDAVRAAVDETRFQQLATQLAQTKTSRRIEQPVAAMKVLGQRVGLSEGEQKSVLTHLVEGSDLSQFGAINAVTRTAQDIESYDRSIELEQIGASVMELSPRDWERVATAA
jgi:hypothetical protein